MQVYQSPEELWEAVAKRRKDAMSKNSHSGTTATTTTTTKNSSTKSKKQKSEDDVVWYDSAVKYWDNQAATDDGVLGGYGFVSDVDIRDSKKFLLKAMGPYIERCKDQGRKLVAVDCGAGVGRISYCLLLHIFDEVDLLEPSKHLLEAARHRLCSQTVPKSLPFPATHRAVNFFLQGLESFHPEPGRYDCIWIQWAMLYLTDDDAVALLHRCVKSLEDPDHGTIFIKENVCAEGFIMDSEDASVTRSHAYYVELFTKRAGLRLVHTALQKDFPRQLFKVRHYALRASSSTTTSM